MAFVLYLIFQCAFLTATLALLLAVQLPACTSLRGPSFYYVDTYMLIRLYLCVCPYCLCINIPIPHPLTNITPFYTHTHTYTPTVFATYLTLDHGQHGHAHTILRLLPSLLLRGSLSGSFPLSHLLLLAAPEALLHWPLQSLLVVGTAALWVLAHGLLLRQVKIYPK